MTGMDVDTEEDITPRPRKHQATVLDRFNWLENSTDDADDEDDKAYQTPSVLLKKKRYQAKIVEEDEEDREDDADREDDENRRKVITVGDAAIMTDKYVLIIVC